MELVFRSCPAERAGRLEAQVRAALGAPPPAAAVEEVLPADAGRVDDLAGPLASWLRVWDWSPVLLADVLAGWELVLEAVHRLSAVSPARSASMSGLVVWLRFFRWA